MGSAGLVTGAWHPNPRGSEELRALGLAHSGAKQGELGEVTP